MGAEDAALSWKRLFSRSLAADPGRLHVAAHSHHLWPDAALEGHAQAAEDAARLADRKWDHVMGPLWGKAQAEVAAELALPDPATIAFSSNTHDFLLRMVSALPQRPLRVLATNGEFHSFSRQIARWVESGDVLLETAPPDALAGRAEAGSFDLVFASHVLFGSGAILPGIDRLAALARPGGPWVVLDLYHAFMAMPVDFAAYADRLFLLGGGYKYAMAGEGACFLHAPPGFAPRPAATGWYAAFDELAGADRGVGYAPDGRRFLGSTFDPSGLYRFVAVRRMLAAEGLSTAAISAHVTALQHGFVRAAAMPGFTLLNPPGEGPQARFLAWRGDGAAGLYEALMAHYVVTDVRGDVLRIGFGLYHDESDVDRLVAHIAMCRE